MHVIQKQIGECEKEDVMCPEVNQVEQTAACVHDASRGVQVWDQWLPNKTARGFIAGQNMSCCFSPNEQRHDKFFFGKETY